MSLLNRVWRVTRFAISGGLGRKGARKLSSLTSVFEESLYHCFTLPFWLLDDVSLLTKGFLCFFFSFFLVREKKISFLCCFFFFSDGLVLLETFEGEIYQYLHLRLTRFFSPHPTIPQSPTLISRLDSAAGSCFLPFPK